MNRRHRRPWVVNGTSIAGLSAHRYPTQPGVLYGPYFNDNTAAFWNAVQNWPAA